MIKNFKYTIPEIIGFAILIVVYFYSKSCSPTTKGGQIQSLNLVVSTPMLKSENGQLVDLIDTLKIISSENFTMIGTPYASQISNITTDENGNIIKDKLIKNELKYKFYAFQKGDIYGLSFDSINTSKAEIFLVDSFLIERTYKNVKFVTAANDSLVEILNSQGNLIQKYIPKVKYDYTYPDSTYLYYSNNLKNIRFSFFKEMDSIKNMKLYKILLIYNSIPKGKYSFVVPRRELSFELQTSPIIDSIEILNFLERFKKMNY